MRWYSKYLTVFEKPYEDTPIYVIEEVFRNLQNLQSEKPLASVILISHNEERRLLSCLWSLSESKCKYPVEIIGVNNNSSDRTADVYSSVGCRYYDEEKKSPGHARNRGLREAKGKYTICIDSDTIYPPKYLEEMIDALEKPGVVAAFALWSYVPSKEYPRFKMFFYELARDIHLSLLYIKSPERCVRGLVFAHVTDLAKKIGYKTNIIRGEDGSMAYRLKNYGKITFVRERCARPVTCTATLKADGSLSKAFIRRVILALKGFRKYIFKTKGEIKDQQSNIVKDS